MEAKLEALTNVGMIDQMHHELKRFQSVNQPWININAIWQRWIRR